ncbi:MAG: serine hydrolase [Thalassobaculaceae bacterium]|nr:serine hydrolase [Thalassobaculaceae bacterium]
MAPGLVHAVLRDGVLRAESDPRPVIWWSLTKTVVAAAALRLVEQGALSLDDPLPERPYTLRQLLRHSAGLPTYGGPEYHGAVARGEAPWSDERMLVHANADTPLYAPDQGWAYSNAGYLFGRRLIEAATGQSFGDALRALVLDPLDLSGTRIVTLPQELEATVWGNPTGYHPGWVYHGLLIGPARDAVRFLDGIGRLLEPGSWEAMRDPYPVGGTLEGRPWTQPDYGLGLMTGEWGDAGRVYGHSGVGHTVAALYAFADLPGRPVVAAFAPGSDEAVVENEALRLVLTGQT